jgi:hypothetical protein
MKITAQRLRFALLAALVASLLTMSVLALRHQESIEPDVLPGMVAALSELPPPGLMCATKPHLPRLMGMEFLPLRRGWDLDSVRAHGGNYMFLGPREMAMRPKMKAYAQGEPLPPWAHTIIHWPKQLAVVIQLEPPDEPVIPAGRRELAPIESSSP